MCNRKFRVGVLGLGISNISLLGLDRFRDCDITVRSRGPIDPSVLPRHLNIRRITVGNSWLDRIDEDLLIASPSVRRDAPELTNAVKRGCVITSDAEIFFEENQSPVYAVTGSDGKSTTATLISLLLNESGYNCRLIGNVGIPMTKSLGKSESFSVELSSFMLNYIIPKTSRACITNITPNHLDWHSSYEEYVQSKTNILKNTEFTALPSSLGDGHATVGYAMELSQLKKKNPHASIYISSDNESIFRNGEPIIELSNIARNEHYNIQNLMMAIAMTDGLVEYETIARVAKDFHGLSHRCELFMTRDGVDYYDSSIDSTPSRTAQTLGSLDREVVIILGGKGKGLDYRKMQPELKKYARGVVITGENARDIFNAIDFPEAKIISDFTEAALCAEEMARGVGVLLLSPASTSYDRFKNFEERGRFFKEIMLKSK